MTITIPDDKAKQLLASLPNSPIANELKVKLADGLDRSRNMSADELDMVLVVLDAMTPAKLEAIYKPYRNERPIDAVVMLSRFRSAQSKLRSIHARQYAREQGRG